METLGETLAARRHELTAAIVAAQARLEEFDGAWSRHDMAWLTEERFIAARLAQEVEQARAVIEG
jgi:hypothetical protein